MCVDVVFECLLKLTNLLSYSKIFNKENENFDLQYNLQHCKSQHPFQKIAKVKPYLLKYKFLSE